MAIKIFNHDKNSHDVSFVGCVLSLREKNGYDDSDFFARVWDEEKQNVHEVMYATTRGWTYKNGATIDATDDVKAKAEAWEERVYHRQQVRQQWIARQRNNYLAALLGLTRKQIIKLRGAYPDTSKIVSGGAYAIELPQDSAPFVACIKLLSTRKDDAFRSDFRKSMADQVHCWITSSNSKYATPLSPKQISYAIQPNQYIMYPHTK